MPSGIVRVDADLEGTAAAAPDRVVGAAALSDAEKPMAGETATWPMVVLALILVGAAGVILTLSRRYWGRWQTWIVAVPLLAALGVLAATRIGTLLPNLL